MKRSSLVILSLLLISSGEYYWYSRSSPAPTGALPPIRVSTGSIESTIKTTGNIRPAQQLTLMFAREGIVTDIRVKIGDTVTAGQILASVDPGNALLEVKSAELSLANAKLSYEKLLSSATDVDKIRARNTLEQSQASLALLENRYQSQIQDQSGALSDALANLALLESKWKLAESDLEYMKKSLSTDTKDINLDRDLTSAVSALSDLDRTYRDIQRDLSEIMLLTDRSNARYGDLGVLDESNKARAESLALTLCGTYDQYQKQMWVLLGSDPIGFDPTLTTLTTAKSLLTDANLLTTLILQELETTKGVNYSNDFLESEKSRVTAAATTLGSKLSSINTSLANLRTYGAEDLQSLADANTITTKAQAVTTAKNTYEKALRDLEALRMTQKNERISSENGIRDAKNTLALNQVSLETLLAGPTLIERQQATNSIKNAELSLEKANQALDDYRLIAPFDGVVEDIPWNIGETATTTEGILVSNKDAYEIELSLDQIDIVKVRPGMRATIVLDAFPKTPFTGSVARINAAPTITSWVVSYTATVVLTLDRDDIFSEMSATVSIILASKQDIITVPSSAITTEREKSSVMRRESRNSQVSTKTEVVTGLSEGGQTEIVSGLRVWDYIERASIKTSSGSGSNSSSSSSRSNRSTFWGPPPGL